MRVRGGTAGILALLAFGRLDIDGFLAEPRRVGRLTPKRQREAQRRQRELAHWRESRQA